MPWRWSRNLDWFRMSRWCQWRRFCEVYQSNEFLRQIDCCNFVSRTKVVSWTFSLAGVGATPRRWAKFGWCRRHPSALGQVWFFHRLGFSWSSSFGAFSVFYIIPSYCRLHISPSSQLNPVGQVFIDTYFDLQCTSGWAIDDLEWSSPLWM